VRQGSGRLQWPTVVEIKVSRFEKRNGGISVSYRRGKGEETERCRFPCFSVSIFLEIREF
jgi:hypothetical protein